MVGDVDSYRSTFPAPLVHPSCPSASGALPPPSEAASALAATVLVSVLPIPHGVTSQGTPVPAELPLLVADEGSRHVGAVVLFQEVWMALGWARGRGMMPKGACLVE